MQRAKEALQSLPWVDQESVKADISTERVEFALKDAKQFNEKALLDAFTKVNFPDTKVMSRPK